MRILIALQPANHIGVNAAAKGVAHAASGGSSGTTASVVGGLLGASGHASFTLWIIATLFALVLTLAFGAGGSFSGSNLHGHLKNVANVLLPAAGTINTKTGHKASNYTYPGSSHLAAAVHTMVSTPLYPFNITPPGQVVWGVATVIGLGWLLIELLWHVKEAFDGNRKPQHLANFLINAFLIFGAPVFAGKLIQYGYDNTVTQSLTVQHGGWPPYILSTNFVVMSYLGILTPATAHAGMTTQQAVNQALTKAVGISITGGFLAAGLKALWDFLKGCAIGMGPNLVSIFKQVISGTATGAVDGATAAAPDVAVEESASLALDASGVGAPAGLVGNTVGGVAEAGSTAVGGIFGFVKGVGAGLGAACGAGGATVVMANAGKIGAAFATGVVTAFTAYFWFLLPGLLLMAGIMLQELSALIFIGSFPFITFVYAFRAYTLQMAEKTGLLLLRALAVSFILVFVDLNVIQAASGAKGFPTGILSSVPTTWDWNLVMLLLLLVLNVLFWFIWTEPFLVMLRDITYFAMGGGLVAEMVGRAGGIMRTGGRFTARYGHEGLANSFERMGYKMQQGGEGAAKWAQEHGKSIGERYPDEEGVSSIGGVAKKGADIAGRGLLSATESLALDNAPPPLLYPNVEFSQGIDTPDLYTVEAGTADARDSLFDYWRETAKLNPQYVIGNRIGFSTQAEVQQAMRAARKMTPYYRKGGRYYTSNGGNMTLITEAQARGGNYLYGGEL